MLSCHKQWTIHVKSTSYLVFNHCPYYTSHFITVHLNNRTINFYFCCVAICKSSRHQLPNIKITSLSFNETLGFKAFHVLRTFHLFSDPKPKNITTYSSFVSYEVWRKEMNLKDAKHYVFPRRNPKNILILPPFFNRAPRQNEASSKETGGDLALGKGGSLGILFGTHSQNKKL